MGQKREVDIALNNRSSKNPTLSEQLIHITNLSIIISMGRNSICAFYESKKRSRHRTKQQFKQKSHTIRTVPKMPRNIVAGEKNRCPYKYLTAHFPILE